MGTPKKNRRSDTMSITFTKFDSDIYEFLQKQPNASALIRHLVRCYMENRQVVNNTESKNEVTATKSDDEDVESKMNKKNREKIKQLPDL